MTTVAITLPNARFTATRLANDRLALLGINVNEAIEMVKNHQATWPGREDDETWYQGTNAADRTFNVLVKSPHETIALIITVNEL